MHATHNSALINLGVKEITQATSEDPLALLRHLLPMGFGRFNPFVEPSKHCAAVKRTLPLIWVTPRLRQVKLTPWFSQAAVSIRLFANLSIDVTVGALRCDLVTSHPRIPRAVSPRD